MRCDGKFYNKYTFIETIKLSYGNYFLLKLFNKTFYEIIGSSQHYVVE